MPKQPDLVDLVQVTWGKSTHEHPVFSPDGKRLAFYAGTYGWLQIYVCGLDGTERRPLTCGRGNHTQPAWAPDGRTVYYRAQETNDAPWSLWRVRVDDPDVRVRLLADSRVSYKHPSPSPDGKTLAWFSDEGTPGNFHVFTAPVDAAGIGERRRLTDDPNRNDCHPSWSADGQHLLFHAYMGAVDAAESHVFTCDARGGELRRLTTEPGLHKHPFFVGREHFVHHGEDGKGRGLWLRSFTDGRVVARLTGGRKNDKHPHPFVPPAGAPRLAFASKKRGFDVPGEDGASYDLFWGTISGLRVKR
jgi:Tol biopolymer transport system component